MEVGPASPTASACDGQGAGCGQVDSQGAEARVGFLPCRVQTLQARGLPGRGRWSPCPAQLTDMLPSQEFFGIRREKGVSRGFSQRSCGQSLAPTPGGGQWTGRRGGGSKQQQAGATQR